MNKKDHHTDLLSRFVLRRASNFTVKLEMADKYNKTCHEIFFEASHNFDGLVKNISWSAEVGDVSTHLSGTKFVELKINIPPNTSVGEYDFKVLVRNLREIEAVSEMQFDSKTVVLFNPWSSSDTVHLGDPAQLVEYVMNENGILFMNNEKKKEWRFSQFDDITLDVVLKLLEGQKADVRANAMVISRHFSKMANEQDDNGVLVGKWPDQSQGVEAYVSGTVPWYWTGSDNILGKYHSTGSPVKYGQCWVFAGLLTTLLRSVGIPSRPVTNYNSGHDIDNDGIIDVFLHDGKQAYRNEEDKKNKHMDSVWNFHVWNDVYIEEWHAVDGTPQELSGGVYQLGPAPHKAIKSKSGGNYDVDFVVAEVDALYRVWHKSFYNGAYKLSSKGIDSTLIGRLILTKEVGTSARTDITSLYKTPEITLPSTAWVVDVAFSAPTEVAAGSNITFDVTLSNSTSDLRVRIFISTSAISYDGTFLALLKNKEMFADLSSGANLVIPFSVSAAYYLEWTSATEIFKSFVSVEVEGNDFIAAEVAQTTVTFPPPKLEITPNISLANKTDGNATFSFVNSLEYSIKNVTVTFSAGRGLTLGGTRNLDVFVGTLLAGKTLSVEQAFTATAEGINLMTVSLSGDKASGITAGAYIAVGK
jgi:hypothetical protein